MDVPRLFRKLVGWLRTRRDAPEPGDESQGDPEQSRTSSWRHVSGLLKPLRSAVPDPSEVKAEGAQLFESAQERAAQWMETSAEAAHSLAHHASDRIEAVWKAEEPDQILEESRLFQPLPGESGEVGPELLNLRWRSEALLALSAAGTLSLEDEIIHHTDRLFHSGLPTPELSERIFGRDWSDLHQWIDTVPGSSVPGGGITHRLEHGHDLEAAAEVYQDHGLEGVLVWTQHVGQDAFSITGIPVPAGGKRLAETLVDQGVATRGNAALLVSFNAVELAASFLAGAFALRLAGVLRDMKSQRKVRKRCEGALEARKRGDLDAVIANYSAARSLSGSSVLNDLSFVPSNQAVLFDGQCGATGNRRYSRGETSSRSKARS